MADGESAQKPSAGSYSVSPFVKKEVHDQIANRSAKARVSWNWYDTWHEEHHRAFVVAKLCKADLLQEVHDSLQKAIDEGQTFEEWRKEIQPKLEGRWLGKTVGELWDELPEAEKKRLKEQAQKDNRKDPEPNEKQRQEVISPKRLETIYRTNMKVAHVAGQYQSLVDEAELYPYWQYHTQEDDRVRGSHAILNRKVFRWDDPFWDTHFPPNGWQCRCYVRSLNERGLKRQGLSTDDVLDSGKLKTREDKSAGGHSKLTYIIDGKDAATADGWNYNPGKVNQQIDAVADDKIGDYEPELGQQVKDDLKKEEEPKPAAPKKTSAASGQPTKPSEPAKKTEPEKKAEPKKKAAPKSAADKTNKTKASGKSEAKPAALPAKPEAAAPKPKQADGAHGKPKPATEPKLIKPSPVPINKPAAPRIIEPIKPADPSVPRVVKPIEPIDPSVHRVVEPVKPEAKQGILQTIRGKVSRAVDRVLGWLGVSSKRSSFEKLANEGGQDTYYGNFQPKESQSTAAKEEKKELALVAAQNQTAQAVEQEANQISASMQKRLKSAQASGNRSVPNQIGQNKPAIVQHDDSKALHQQRDQQAFAKDNTVPSKLAEQAQIQDIENNNSDQSSKLKETVQQKTSAGIPLSSDEYKDWLNKTLPLAHERAKLQQSLDNAKNDRTKYAVIKEQMENISRQIAEFGSKVIVAKIPEYIITVRNTIVDLVNNAAETGKKKRYLSNISDNSLWIDIDSGARHATREDKVHPNPDAIINIQSYLQRAQHAGDYGGIYYEYDKNGNSAKHDGDIICIVPDNDFNKDDTDAHQLTKIIITIRKGQTMVKTAQKISLRDYNNHIKNIWHKI